MSNDVVALAALFLAVISFSHILYVKTTDNFNIVVGKYSQIYGGQKTHWW